MIRSNFDDVGTFHARFGLPSAMVDGTGPREVWNDDQLIEFRVKFMQEELDEFIEGRDERDPAKMADALIDLVYVAMGTAHFMGIPWQELWDEVQRANITKVRAAKDGSDSLRGSGFDVVKPAGWRGPDIDGILKKHGFPIKDSEDAA